MTATTFDQFVAEQDARNTVQLNVTKWTWLLCDALRQNYIDYIPTGHEGYVHANDYGTFKLVNREVFSFHNFTKSKCW